MNGCTATPRCFDLPAAEEEFRGVTAVGAGEAGNRQSAEKIHDDGVHGMLDIGLLLVCLRAMSPQVVWLEGLLKFSFWALNMGLLTMCVGSLLPVGLLQTWASMERRYWCARSTEFLGTPLMQTLRWLCVPGGG
jgi:hypothetical protein